MISSIRRRSVTAVFVVIVALATPCAAEWVLIDDFQSYTVGDDLDGLSDGSGMWTSTIDFFAIEGDPTDAVNQVMAALEVDSGAKQAFLDDPAIDVADGTIGTLFARFYRDSEDTHVNFGLSDVEDPAAWGDFESQIRDQTGIAFARDGGQFTEFDNIDELPVGEWLNYWIVIDNDADTNEYYLQSDSTLPTQLQLSASGRDVFDFRNGTTDPLVRFFFRTNNESQWIHVGPWYLDDIYLDTTGENLTNPTTEGATPLLAGDADMDCDFDQLDLVQVQVAAKYLTGEAATWGEGDWDGAPGGSVEDKVPPPGNGQFDQLDIIAALAAGTYLQGAYCAEGGFAAQAVPEPTTLSLLALGLTGVLLGRRRRA